MSLSSSPIIRSLGMLSDVEEDHQEENYNNEDQEEEQQIDDLTQRKSSLSSCLLKMPRIPKSSSSFSVMTQKSDIGYSSDADAESDEGSVDQSISSISSSSSSASVSQSSSSSSRLRSSSSASLNISKSIKSDHQNQEEEEADDGLEDPDSLYLNSTTSGVSSCSGGKNKCRRRKSSSSHRHYIYRWSYHGAKDNPEWADWDYYLPPSFISYDPSLKSSSSSRRNSRRYGSSSTTEERNNKTSDSYDSFEDYYDNTYNFRASSSDSFWDSDLSRSCSSNFTQTAEKETQEDQHDAQQELISSLNHGNLGKKFVDASTGTIDDDNYGGRVVHVSTSTDDVDAHMMYQNSQSKLSSSTSTIRACLESPSSGVDEESSCYKKGKLRVLPLLAYSISGLLMSFMYTALTQCTPHLELYHNHLPPI